MRESFRYALRLAARSHLRSPGMAATAMLTLGAGLTAAVVVLGFIDGSVRPLPVPRGQDVVSVQVRDAQARLLRDVPPVGTWVDAPGVADAGAVRTSSATLRHPAHAALHGTGAALHPSVLRLLQVQPAVGRLPTADHEDEHGIVLGWRLYEELGGDPSILGDVILLDDAPHTLIGVMPAGFGFPERHDFWTVLPPDDVGEVVVRLEPGAHRKAVSAALAARLDRVATGDGAPHRVELRDWTTSREGDTAETVILAGLGVLVLLLLLVCCANVATLLLVRGTERAGTLAVQGALGATRGKLAVQLLMESLVVAVGGGVLGLAGGFLALRIMELRLSSHWGYYWMVMEVRTSVLLMTLGLVFVTALAAGVVPAIRASRVNLAALIASQGRGTGDKRQRRLGRWFVGSQVALSSVGLIAAVFMAREFRELGRSTERLPMDAVAVAAVRVPDDAYVDAGARAALVERLGAELGRLAGVSGVSVSTAVPGPGPFAVITTPATDPEALPRRVQYVAADPHLLQLYGMRLVAGQPLTEGAGHAVALVSSGVAERYYDGAAVGERIRLNGVHGDDEWAHIVGVFEDWLPDYRGAGSERVIVPLDFASSDRLYVSLLTTGDAGALLGGVREAVRRVDERMPVELLQTLRARMEWFNRMMKVIAGFGAFGGLASAVVAAIGLYGVMAFQVRARRREIGIRMAVGAARSRILLETLRESLLRIVPGLVVGIGGAVFVIPALASRVPDADPGTMFLRMAAAGAIAAGVLVVIGALAAFEPALRAARLDPQEVLRSGS